MSQRILKITGGVAALAVVIAAAVALAGGSPSSSNAAATAQPVAMNGYGPQGGMPGRPGAGAPPAGFGTPVTGDAAAKVKAAALAKVPGTVERVMQLPDGSYVAHVIRSSGGEVYVLVGKDFKVTGTQAGGPQGAPGAMGGQDGAGHGAGAPPAGFGTPVTGDAAAKVEAAALAKVPGTVERVMQLPDGGYVAHVIRSSGGEVHVLVGKDFKVTGIAPGPPAGGPEGAAPGAPQGMAPGGAQGAPQGAPQGQAD